MNTQTTEIAEEQEQPLQRTPPRTLVNSSTKGTYTPTAWPVRAGGSDHLLHRSKNS